jgi:hypothetical protein
MGRASGRKNLPRAPQAGPGTPEGDEIGLSALQDPAGSPIPGLTGNIANYETARQKVPVGEALPEHRGMMAHGVPPEEAATTEERALMERAGTLAQHRPPTPPQTGAPRPRPPAVPVYIVEGEGGPRVIRSAAPRHIQVPAAGADPVRVCGISAARVRIGLLNEDTATNIRFANKIGDLSVGGGALLPYPVNSYQWFRTQDELYAISAGAALLLSIIEEYEQEL